MKLRSWLPCRGCRRAEHRAIADAVLARDADRACDLLAEHFEGTTRINLRAEGMALGGDGAR